MTHVLFPLYLKQQSCSKSSIKGVMFGGSTAKVKLETDKRINVDNSKCLLIWSVLKAQGQGVSTFDSSCRAVRAELLSERRVLLLELLQVLRQTMNRGAQRFLLPLGAFTLHSTTVGRNGEGRVFTKKVEMIVLFFFNIHHKSCPPCLSGHPGSLTTTHRKGLL